MVTKCFNCVCHYCTRMRCPWLKARQYPLNVCFRKAAEGCCPTWDCDFFVNSRIHRVYQVKRKSPSTKTDHDLLVAIAEHLGVFRNFLDKR